MLSLLNLIIRNTKVRISIILIVMTDDSFLDFRCKVMTSYIIIFIGNNYNKDFGVLKWNWNLMKFIQI